MNDKTDNFDYEFAVSYGLVGRITTQTTMIEGMIDAYIAEFYTRCPAGGDYQNSYLSFIYDVLYEQSMSLYTKIKILFKIYKRIYNTPVPRKTKKLFEDWLAIRNKVAHGNHMGMNIYYRGEPYNIKDLADAHFKLQLEISAELIKYDPLQGLYFNYHPSKT